MPPPTLAQVQNLTNKAYTWVANSRRPAPQNDGVDRGYICMSMYRALPLTAKIPPGYSVAGFNACHYVRHAGTETVVNGTTVPSMTITPLTVSDLFSQVYVTVGPWPDGQPDLHFYVNRSYSQSTGRTTVTVSYAGKPGQDSRQYPIKFYWGPKEILSDHRTFAKVIYSGFWGPAIGQRGNKYYVRSEDLLALYLTEGESWHPQLNAWCADQWGNVHQNIYAAMFKKGLELRTDRIYDAAGQCYADCWRSHQGCPSGWPADMYRGASSGGWGGSHRSKTCLWPGGYVEVLKQDPLGLLSQAVHALIKTNNPWHVFYGAWPISATKPPPTAFTPIGIANWVYTHYYRQGIGVHMFNLPVIGNDYRCSSMRTNAFSILCTLLGYRYLIGNWSVVADELAAILRDTSIGFSSQTPYGCWKEATGNQTQVLCRPDYTGAQLMIWDQMPNGALGLKIPGNWLREFLDLHFNLPPDDGDYILSTMETTALYCQALRVYGYHKYGWLFGTTATLPGA